MSRASPRARSSAFRSSPRARGAGLVRLMINAAEPVRALDVDQFYAAFAIWAAALLRLPNVRWPAAGALLSVIISD